MSSIDIDCRNFGIVFLKGGLLQKYVEASYAIQFRMDVSFESIRLLLIMSESVVNFLSCSFIDLEMNERIFSSQGLNALLLICRAISFPFIEREDYHLTYETYFEDDFLPYIERIVNFLLSLLEFSCSNTSTSFGSITSISRDILTSLRVLYLYFGEKPRLKKLVANLNNRSESFSPHLRKVCFCLICHFRSNLCLALEP